MLINWRWHKRKIKICYFCHTRLSYPRLIEVWKSLKRSTYSHQMDHSVGQRSGFNIRHNGHIYHGSHSEARKAQHVSTLRKWNMYLLYILWHFYAFWVVCLTTICKSQYVPRLLGSHKHNAASSLIERSRRWTKIDLCKFNVQCLLDQVTSFMYRIKPEELYIPGCWKGRGRRPRTFPQQRM